MAGFVLLVAVTFAIHGDYNSAVISPTGVPPVQIWLDAVGRTGGELLLIIAFVLGLPYLGNSTAYFAVTSIATIGLYIAYVIPTLLRRLAGASFAGGRWSLGRWSAVVGWIGIAWVAFITVLFMLPEVSPITWKTFNYAPVAVGVVLLYSGGYWLLSARKWFTGPRVQGSATELERIEAGLQASSGK